MFLGQQIAPSTGEVSRRRYARERKAREEAESLLEAKSRELFESNQRLQRLLGSLETAVKERTKELEEARSAAEAANEAKSIFLASISHEIRTPLNGILGMAQALEDSGLLREQRKLVELLRDSGNLLLSLINDVLDLSKIEAGKLDFEYIPYALTDLVESMQQQFGFRAREKGLDFEVHFSDRAKSVVRTDPVRLQQVVGNLLSNAIKFTTSGCVRLKVDLLPRSDGRARVVLTVSDTGPGIPKEQQAHLFQRFSQANSSITRQHGGTGLGLAISRQICELQGGTVTLRSDVGQGAAFAASLTVDVLADKDTTLQADAVGTTQPSLKGLKVLAAEDNKTNQIVLRHMLKKFDLSLTIVSDGAEAVQEWEKGEFDLILMDINMPGMDGIEATRQIRQCEYRNMSDPIPILAVSANAMVHQVAGYMSEGMSGHVPKPISRDTLATAMQSALRTRGVLP
ncbi:hypothetical protein NBRC116594_25680 [Shimia sp. NS0008-38b]|uniref:ATP-binding protein n=1 Tax=Shimia sp. NS0008-38b TaxID=3127653 RepID=UPI003109FECF